jgi:acetyl esterase/lipase
VDIQRRAFLGGIALLAGSAAAAQAPTPYRGDPDAPFFPPKERFPLWPGQPPGAPKTKIVPNWTMNNAPPNRELWIRGVPFPEVHVFRPARPDGSSMLAFPGGGYEFLSVQNEGLDVAERFNADRTTVFVLTYRLPGEGWANRHLVPLQDAQRAMRLIRSRAADFRIDPARLGVIGFSAGGHLAADLAVAHNERVYAPVDAADSLSARPAYVGLIYAVTTLINPGASSTSGNGLFGPSAPQAELEARSPVLHVTKDTPPSFIAHAMDDNTVGANHGANWIIAMQKEGASVEGHFFADGGHGFGLHLPKDLPGSRWPDLFALWMRKHGA